MDSVLGGVGDLRRSALALAHGQVLEVGFGTGHNVAHYPKEVRSLVALDPLDALRKRVERRIASAPFQVDRVNRPADTRLPFEDGRFDCVVTTWTLCSIPDLLSALTEMRRVLRPDGLYLFLEHGRSDDARIARWQRRFNPIQRRLGCGCLLDVAVDEVVRSAGFEITELRRFVRSGEIRLGAEMYQGVAHVGTRPAR